MASTTFLEVVFRADEFAFDGRDEIEDPLDEALAESGLGEVTGGGSGLGTANIDVEVTDLVRAIQVIKQVLRELKVGQHTIINQYEPQRIVHNVYE